MWLFLMVHYFIFPSSYIYVSGNLLKFYSTIMLSSKVNTVLWQTFKKIYYVFITYNSDSKIYSIIKNFKKCILVQHFGTNENKKYIFWLQLN